MRQVSFPTLTSLDDLVRALKEIESASRQSEDSIATQAGQQLSVRSFAITAITRANPCVMTIPGHTMIAGDFFFVSGVGGMTQANYKWYSVASVSGGNVTVNGVNAIVGRLVAAGAVDSSGYSAYTSGGTASPQSTRGIWTWPTGITLVRVCLWGSGGAGGGSSWLQFGGAGGSGANVEALIPRPASGVSSYIIDRGMPGIQAAVLNTNFLYAGPTAFGTWSYTPPGTPAFDGTNPATDTPVTVPSMTGDCWAHGAGVGQRAGGAQIGGDGGTPGVGSGTYVYRSFPGGMGGASMPAIKDFSGVIVNAYFPAGGTAPGGANGSNNGQDGQMGGGGASGSNATGVDAAGVCTAGACVLTGGRELGQSGAGGPGSIVVYPLAA